MDYIVLDLEWNQASDLKTKNENSLLFEIIEIGAVKLNEKRRQIDSFHELIKPQVFMTMNQITGELVHLKIEDLSNCRDFQDVVKDFLKWCGNDYVFCTWGNLDLLELQRNIDYYGLPRLANNKPIKFYDVQKLFAIAFENEKSRRTLEYAIDYLDIEKDIPFHRADSDAYYTAKVLDKIKDKNVFTYWSYDTYQIPRRRKDEIRAVFNTYSKYISKGFIDKQSAIADREVLSTRCYMCDRNIKRKIPWFSLNGKHYYTVAHCNEHGYFKGKIRVKKAIDDKVYVIKTIKWIPESEVSSITDKKQQMKELRKERKLKSK